MIEDSHIPPHADKAVPYSSFAELLKNEVEGRDFIRFFQVRESPVMIVAPHGGGIEPGTSEIALAIAGDEYSLYCFESLKTNGNELMHITSHAFDDPLCINLARRAQVVLSIHGCGDEQARVFVGGRHGELQEHLLATLNEAGFNASFDDGRHPGKHLDNVCNLGQSQAGIQLEISLGLRRKMFSGLRRVERKTTLPPFVKFIEAVRKVFHHTDLLI